MKEYIAHIRYEDEKEVVQSVKAHLEQVAQITSNNASKIGLAKVGEIIGLLHDFGKYSSAFQNYIGSATGVIDQDEDDYVDAVKSLKKYSQGRTVVASQFVHGEVSSIQVCITKYGIFSGGIQRQLVDSKYLCNPKLEGATRWCGGEIGAEYPDIVQHRAQEIASVIGSELSSHGYKESLAWTLS